MESRQSSISIWTRNWIYNNRWYINHLSYNDIWGLYWECLDFPDIHRLFKVPYDELMQILYVLTKEINLSYNDFNNMNFFEILTILQTYEEHMKEQQKHDKKENERMERQMSDMQNKYNFNDIKQQMNNHSDFSKMSMPNFNMPKLN